MADIVASKTAAIPSCSLSAPTPKKRGRKPKGTVVSDGGNADGVNAGQSAENKPAKRGRKSAAPKQPRNRRSQEPAFNPFLAINRVEANDPFLAINRVEAHADDDACPTENQPLVDWKWHPKMFGAESVTANRGEGVGDYVQSWCDQGTEHPLLEEKPMISASTDADDENSSSIGATTSSSFPVQPTHVPISRPVRVIEKRSYTRFYNPYSKVYGWFLFHQPTLDDFGASHHVLVIFSFHSGSWPAVTYLTFPCSSLPFEFLFLLNSSELFLDNLFQIVFFSFPLPSLFFHPLLTSNHSNLPSFSAPFPILFSCYLKIGKGKAKGVATPPPLHQKMRDIYEAIRDYSDTHGRVLSG